MSAAAGSGGVKPSMEGGRGRVLWHVMAALAVTVLIVGEAGAFAEAVVWTAVTTLHLSQYLFWIGAALVGVVTLVFATKMFVHMMRVEARLDRNERTDDVPWTIFK